MLILSLIAFDKLMFIIGSIFFISLVTTTRTLSNYQYPQHKRGSILNNLLIQTISRLIKQKFTRNHAVACPAVFVNFVDKHIPYSCFYANCPVFGHATATGLTACFNGK